MAASFEAFEAWIESNGEIEFDMYAQELDRWSWLQDFIPTIVISSAGGIAPFQAEGLLQGLPFYYRDRHGYATLSVAGDPDGEKPYLGEKTYYQAGIDTEEFQGGEHFIKNLMKLVPQLKPTPYPYSFLGKKLNFTKDEGLNYTVSETETETWPGWGFTAEEAYAALQEPNEYLLSRGYSREKLVQMVKDQEFSPIPVSPDPRVYPEILPNFTVNYPNG